MKGHISCWKGKKLSEEHKRKISETKKRLFTEGKLVPPFKNKYHSNETKRKISLKKIGKKFSYETKKKMSEIQKLQYKSGRIQWNKGKCLSEEARKKMSESRKGKKRKPFTEEWKRKISQSHNGKHHTEESNEKNRIAHLGLHAMEKNPAWKGGLSFEPYGIEFNDNLKEQIRQRDNYRCQECFRHQDELYNKNGKKRKLAIHHIDFNKKNNNLNNLISLCDSCHSQTQFDRDKWTDYFKEKINERE